MFKPSAARYCRGLGGEVRIRPYSAAALGIAVASVVIDTPSPNTEDDIAYYYHRRRSERTRCLARQGRELSRFIAFPFVNDREPRG
jgi:hypothetical protein